MNRPDLLPPFACQFLFAGFFKCKRYRSDPLPPASLDAKQTEALATFLAVCRDRLPPEPDKPPRTEIEQEIAELEYRLEHLRKSLDEPAAVQAGIPVEPERTP